MKKYNTVTLIGTIAFLFVVIVYATYAYVNPVTDLKDLNIAADISSPLAFTASGGNNFNLYVDMESMTPDKANNVVAESTDNIVISLDTDGIEGICCNYTIDWVWDETDIVANQYSISEGATNEYVLTGSMSETYLASDGMTNSVLHANPKFNSQIPNYNVSSLSNTMYSGQICNNTRTLTTHAEQTYTLNASFYNMPVVQDKFKGVSLNGSVKVANVSCVRNDDDSDKVIALSERVFSLANGAERISSQDGSMYKVQQEMISAPSENAIFTTLSKAEYGDVKMYRHELFYNNSEEINNLSDYLTYNNDEWTFNYSNVLNQDSYYFLMPITESGYYKFCYEFPVSSTHASISLSITDELSLYKSGVSINLLSEDSFVKNSSAVEVNGCANIGHAEEGEIFVLKTSSTYPVDTTSTFSLLRTNDEIDVNAGIRYRGKNPNNYVKFNGETWRIIGLFEGDDLNLEETKKYTKIVREESIGEKAWDSSGTNNWTTSSLNSYLNSQYYFSIKDQSLVQETYLPMGQAVNPYLGAPEFFLSERLYGQFGIDAGFTITPTNLGLLYASDFLYAEYDVGCKKNGYAYEENSCMNFNWLKNEETEWLLTPLSITQNSYGDGLIIENGGITDTFTDGEFGFGPVRLFDSYFVRPTLYLKSDVIITGGDGSKDNPYTLALGDKQAPEFYICYQQYAGTEECKNHHPENTIEASGLGMTYGYYYTGDGEVSLSCEGDECTRGVAMELDSLNNKFTLAGANNGLAYSANFNLVVNTSETNEFKSGTFVYEAIHRYEEEL